MKKKKKKKKNVFTGATLALALLAAGCAAKPQTTTPAAQARTPPDSAHNARNSLNWEGAYAGTIPAASGPGIEVQITLRKDLTYTARCQYIEREDPGFTVEGTFDWDAGGRIIRLDTKEMPPYYLVGEEKLIQLDMEGNPITGMLADNYALAKQP